MIIKALYDYYERMLELGEIAPFGFEEKQIPFEIVIDETGKFVGLNDTRESKKDKGRKFVVPKAKSRSGKNAWMSPNVLWDHTGFVLGKAKDDTDKAREDAKNQSGAFLALVSEIEKKYPSNKEIAAVAKFLNNPDKLEEVSKDSKWAECEKIPGCNVIFKIAGKLKTVCANKDVATFVNAELGESVDSQKSVCLVTGEKSEIAITHSGLTFGGNSGVRLVSFQKNSGFDSYNKEQGANAPISRKAEVYYTSALGKMIAHDSQNKVSLGTVTVLFWGEEKNELENCLGPLLNAPAKDNPNAYIAELKKILTTVRTMGTAPTSDKRFYVVGLAANKSRMLMRFWVADSVKNICANIARHFDDFEIARGKFDRELFSLFNILTQMAFDYKLDNLPPKLEGDILKSMMTGAAYPHTMQLQCINRIRADRKIGHIRAATLKAYLNRKQRILKNKTEKEIEMSLDTSNTNMGYLCGRLFALLEKIQEEALGKLDATIVDRYYGSASSTPVAVFSRLLDLANHHLAKIENQGLTIARKKELQEIFDKIPATGFPAHLSLDDQSRFAIGYYHQRQALFTKKEKE